MGFRRVLSDHGMKPLREQRIDLDPALVKEPDDMCSGVIRKRHDGSTLDSK
jgi:hypothetical protein